MRVGLDPACGLAFQKPERKDMKGTKSMKNFSFGWAGPSASGIPFEDWLS
jgi:hypothetical protein